MGYIIARFQVFIAVNIQNSVFCDMTPRGSFKNRRLGGITSSIFFAERISELGATLAVTSSLSFSFQLMLTLFLVR
jgi:hypothetical protein